ncbi:hypothetical protein JY552_04405 [Serratia marcescens]|nr:hypothetical protein [Serratia marcescens]
MTTIKRFTPDYKMHAVRFEAFAREAEHGEYVRFDAHQQKVSALEAERDALADRVERLSGMLTESRAATKSAEERADALEVRLRNALSSEQEAIQRAHAANQTADALAVENVDMRGVIDAAIGVANNSSGIAGWHLNGEIADWDEILPELNIETPATDAALAAIRNEATVRALNHLRDCQLISATVAELKADELRGAK